MGVGNEVLGIGFWELRLEILALVDWGSMIWNWYLVIVNGELRMEITGLVTGNPNQRIGNEELVIGNREQGTGNWFPGVNDFELGIGNEDNINIFNAHTVPEEISQRSVLQSDVANMKIMLYDRFQVIEKELSQLKYAIEESLK